MTTFFVGGSRSQDWPAEETYQELRELSEHVAGCPARTRRIFQLSCRLDGKDCNIEVGCQLPLSQDVVSAIIDHGREEAFVIHTAEAAGGMGSPVRVRNPVYSVTEFS